MTRIYLASASSEIEVVEHYRDRAVALGYKITKDWTLDVRNEGGGNPLNLPLSRQYSYAETDMMGVMSANVFWLIIPTKESVGCYVEFGWATQSKEVDIIVSGNWRNSLMFSMAHHRYNTHEEALEFLRQRKIAIR